MENLNSVCYVAKIDEIKTIEGADNIEQGIIGGWNCIIKKGEYKAGDLVVVATTDAVIPQELSDEMNVTNYLRKGGRVRTVKLRGVYSECLIIPIRFLSGKVTMGDWDLGEGSDCMKLLGIYKYEPPAKQIQLASGKKIKYRDNPNFHVYYKFPNLKNVKGMFTEEDEVQITRKLHGTNARYGIVRKTKLSFLDKVKKFFRLADEWIDYEYVYGSHNVEKGSDSQGFYSTDVWREIAEKYQIKEKLHKHIQTLYDFRDKVGEYGFEGKEKTISDFIGSGYVIYGEIYGPGIQKNFDYGLKEIEFAGFDVTIDGKYLEPGQSEFHIESYLGLSYVPVLYYGNWSQEVQDHYTFNNFIKGTKVPHEGIVIKYHTGERQRVAKVINPDYLIYGEKHDVGDSH
jgi:RNA ligase (TIGR02306 family)